MKVTIVGVKQAKLGHMFLFSGAADSCKHCKYYQSCIGTLENGRVYTIRRVMDREIPCLLHLDGGKVVEVEEPSKEVLIDSRSAIQGAIIRLDLSRCERFDCKNSERCFPLGLVDGDRCRVLEVAREATCSLGLRLVAVSVQREPVVS